MKGDRCASREVGLRCGDLCEPVGEDQRAKARRPTLAQLLDARAAVGRGADLARRREPSRWTIQDRVPQARLYKIWNGPAYGQDLVSRTAQALDGWRQP